MSNNRLYTPPPIPTFLKDQPVLLVKATGEKIKTIVVGVTAKCLWFKDTSTGKTCTIAMKIWDEYSHQSDILGRNVQLPRWVILIWN